MNKGKVGEWVRHTSSSGKEYYFHVNKQTSQWEKPREWLEYEKRHGPVPNAPYVSSSQKQKLLQQQSHNSSSGSSNHVNATNASSSTSANDQRDRDRKSHSSSYHAHHHPHQQQQQQQQKQHNSTSQNSTNNSNSFNNSNYSSTAQNSSSSTTTTGSNAHHHSHPNNIKVVDHHQSGSSSLGAKNDVKNPSQTSTTTSNSNANAASNSTSASFRDTRKPSEDLQAEDMDISPLDDSNSPVPVETNKSTIINSHHQQQPNSYPFQSHYHPHHHPQQYPNLKNLQDISESSSREEYPNRNPNFHQYPNNIDPLTQRRLMHSGNNNNNGYHSRDRDRDRDMRDSPRRPDPRDSRDYKDSRDYRDSYRDKDSRDRDRNDRLRRGDRDRDTRDSPRRYHSDRNDRDRDHRGRNRDRDNRLRHRSGSRLRDERSRSPRERDNTPERPGGESSGVSSGLGSLGALAGLNSETETTPLQSLAQYFRKDLIAHAEDLPGDELERQANLLSDEIMTSSSIQLSKVCAELKMARSQVRLTEIQATLQDQRILFLRQQIKCLEDSDRDNSSSMLGLDTGDS